MFYASKHRAVAMLLLLCLLVSALFAFSVVSSPVRAAPGQAAPLLYDDFTHDASLNGSLWQVNGPVGSVSGPDDVGFNIIPLAPSFSSRGMEIAQINDSQEVGTIESIQSFAPPFTAVATVVGTVSNGHTFGLAVSSANASSGVLVYGNLNPTNCSHLGDCGDPSVCGTSTNGTQPGQCYYGMDAKVGRGGGSWQHVAKLYLTPSVNITYTLQISVDAAGNAQFGVSQGGQLLGSSSAQVGTGPFYVVMEQGEGSPVAHPGPNQAYWLSVSMLPTAVLIGTPTPPSPGSSGFPWYFWVLLALALLVILLIVLFWYRRHKFIVDARDSQTLSPVPDATVSASGPKSLSGTTDKKGRVVFTNPKEGDYSVQAKAPGYLISTPVLVRVEEDGTEYVVKLDRGEQGRPGQAGVAPSGGLGPTATAPTPTQPAAQPTPSATAAPSPAQAPPQPGQEAVEEQEGWGGERIRQVVATFQAKGAVSPETALTAKELGLSRVFVRIMQRRKGRTRVFVEVNGKYYLDQDALRQMKGE